MLIHVIKSELGVGVVPKFASTSQLLYPWLLPPIQNFKISAHHIYTYAMEKIKN
jgi:hypothetical protein